METLPNKKAKDAHIKRVEKGIKEQYTPQMKKLTYAQGKLLIKLVDRECNQPAYELIKAFMGPFKSGCYQAFASVFGASLKKEYKSETDDRLTERVMKACDIMRIYFLDHVIVTDGVYYSYREAHHII